MCAPDQAAPPPTRTTTKDSASSITTTTTTTTTTTRYAATMSRNGSAVRPPQQKQQQQHSIRRRHSMAEASSHMTAGTILSLVFAVVASYLPFFLAPDAAQATYHPAAFVYDPEISHFDNTIWTYGSDYGLAIAMGILMYSFPTTTTTTSTTASTSTTSTMSRTLTYRSKGMLFCYLLSVLAGGVAHQYYTTAEERGHWSFRFLWTICVGTVTLAPAFMGSIGTELDHLDRESYLDDNDDDQEERRQRWSWPSIPAWFWAAYAACSTLVVILGGFSYQRPACDIFMAGVTQTPSTFYVMTILGLGMKKFAAVSSSLRLYTAIGFILNAPLLPFYPLLVQYTNLSLGAINMLLHTWLFIAWSTQGLCLQNICIILDKEYYCATTTTTDNKRLDEKKVD